MGKTTQYYKKAIKRALDARESIVAANEEYERQSALAKSNLEDGILGEVGYQETLERLKIERDAKIENALSTIDAVSSEYSVEMQKFAKLDGNRIDGGAMALLNSGIKMDVAEWQELANVHKDNYVMTRILQERYEAAKPEGELSLQFVQFGQPPMERAKIFENFTGTIRNECTGGYVPSLVGGGIFATREDYFNYLAKDSLGKMQPFMDEDFSSLDTDFPVGMSDGRTRDAGSGGAGFGFNFTPIR